MFLNLVYIDYRNWDGAVPHYGVLFQWRTFWLHRLALTTPRKSSCAYLLTDHCWNRLHSLVRCLPQRPQTRKFTARLWQHFEDSRLWTFKFVWAAWRPTQDSMWFTLLRGTRNDCRQEISRTQDWHLVSWGHPLCHGRGLLTFWRPQNFKLIQKNSGWWFQNPQISFNRLCPSSE